MNNIENDSTFFISIERRKLNQDSNIKIKESKYFVKSIKITKSNNSNINKKIKSNNKISNELSNSNKLFINIPNLKTNNNILSNKNKKLGNKKNESNLLLSSKKKLDEDLDLDINDTDEYNDNNFQINIKHPKLPAYNMSYFENNMQKEFDNNNNSLILKSNNFHKKYSDKKSKSCSFENKDLFKWNLNQKIAALNSKIDMLKNLLRRRYREILELQIFFEKNNSHRKIKKYILQSDILGAELKKQIFKLKMEKLKCEEKYISKKKFDEKINKENMEHSNLKAKIIEKILEYKIFIMENKVQKELITNNDELTIINDSNIFDNYINTIEDRIEKENNLIGLKNINTKNISLNNVSDGEDSVRLNFTDLNNFKNTNNYFQSKFLVKAKINNKNNTKGIYGSNSKFNILINCNKIK